jgi:hypothetical protein
MSLRQKFIKFAVILAVIVAVALGLIAVMRIHQARQLHREHVIRAEEGRSYNARMEKLVLGLSGTNYLLMVTLKIQNPTNEPLKFHREYFVLMTANREFHMPTDAENAVSLIKVAPHGVSVSETFTYKLPPNALDGPMVLRVGPDQWIVLRARSGAKLEPLRDGQFITLRKLKW